MKMDTTLQGFEVSANPVLGSHRLLLHQRPKLDVTMMVTWWTTWQIIRILQPALQSFSNQQPLDKEPMVSMVTISLSWTTRTTIQFVPFKNGGLLFQEDVYHVLDIKGMEWYQESVLSFFKHLFCQHQCFCKLFKNLFFSMSIISIESLLQFLFHVFSSNQESGFSQIQSTVSLSLSNLFKSKSLRIRTQFKNMF